MDNEISMLLDLKVTNFAIIENIILKFKPGFNILSGETGAGKSVLLKSLTLLMGDKSSQETVRTDCDQAIVEGSFDLSKRPDLLCILKDQGIEIFDDLMIVRRVISKEGKSRIYINESLCTLGTLQNIVSPLIELTSKAPLIEMTSQHENRNLMSKQYHMDLLDQYVGILELRAAYSKNFKDFNETCSKIKEFQEKEQAQAQRLDFLKYQRDEIKDLELKSGDEINIENEYRRIKNSAQLNEFISNTEHTLFNDEDSILVRLHKIIQKANEFLKYDENIKNRIDPIIQAKTLIEEAVYDFRSYSSEITSERLPEVEEKMNRLRNLQRKYGSLADEILTAFQSIEEEIFQLQNYETVLKDLIKKKTQFGLVLAKQTHELNKKRKHGAEKLSKEVQAELLDLNMKGIEFKVSIEKLEHYNSSGSDEVQFIMRSSAKDDFRTITKYASGGELSRILLALKKVVGHNEYPRTYLFDEVDNGVSGPTAEKVGRKLKNISKGQQVICVTHLPQVAAYGDVHFLIEKGSNKRGIKMSILDLDKESREQEIARLISGEKISKTSLEHARQLLKESRA